MQMPHYASVVRLKVKAGMSDEFERLAARAYESAVPSIEGRLFSRVIKTGENSYCTYAEWESESALASGRAAMIQVLDTIRPTLEEISSELGVTDPVSGPVILSN